LPPEAEAAVAMLDMASGEMTDDGFIAWVRDSISQSG
jgi:hypothetical protein